MLEFIGGVVVAYPVFMALDRIVRGKRPRREVFILHEYELEEVLERRLALEQGLEGEAAPLKAALPDNVLRFERSK